ncbi:hypothetical protein BGZ65_002941 [Modicella reniformis]|uniref:Xrn1 N-terminal domain-containing protein n=1 Tax=Modicella reniformis TaxID=1440133 RepID=A0A9P6MIW0_9FUNG|nr:hypothetical protein BGZ65_002941 [Modicella reniformis]
MGLKQVGFIDWFQFKFPEAVRNVPRREQARFDSVFVDVNCILHPAVLGAKNEATFIKNLFLILDKLLSQFIPTRICYFSVDGPAPAAKIVTQKSRRATKGGSKASSGMSKLQITPGCPFMTRLERYLSYYAVRYLQQRDKRDVPPTLKFVVDHSNNPGEGESKIIENIVQQANNIRGRPCAIISVDSDAVLQAIAIGVPNVYAVRKGNPSKPVLVISIDRFMRTIEELFPGESDRVRLDFCALCLFRGNDYLRGLTVGLDTLWKAYLYTKLVDPVIQQRGALRHLIDAEFKTFDLVFLKQLLFNSYKNSRNLELPRNLQPRSQLQPQQHPSKSPKPPQSQPTPLQPQPTPLQPQPTPLQPQEQYQAGEGVYELASDMESADEDIDSETDDDEDEDKNKNENNDAEDPITGQDSEDETATKKFSINKFLTGVLWNLEMYCSGKCPDVSFCYNYPSSPPRRALISFVNSTAQMKRYRTLQPSATTKLISVERSDKKYLHPLVCALILLPQEKGAMYLPQSIAPLHTQLVPSESRYLSFDEMEAVDVKADSVTT